MPGRRSPCVNHSTRRYVKVNMMRVIEQKIWQRAAVMYNEAPQDDRDACFRESMMGNFDYFMAFVQSVMDSGIVVPNEHILRATSQGQA